MVTKTQARRKQDIKSKLMAAIAMLLVSSIMMVSSTYAWFTLSTAPEVTGISTAVGANGNLEMALLPTNGQVSSITSGVGDSGEVKGATAANTSWGNLVDLSDNMAYGLDQIKLYPSAANITAAGALDTGAMLQTPTYGADGRVSSLEKNTQTAIFHGADGFKPDESQEYGVRAVGVVSGMTDRQLDYRNARSAANTATSMAKNTASSSLNTNGSALANIAIKKGTNANPTFTQADVNALKQIVNDLLGYDQNGTHVTGALEYIEEAYMQYLLAIAASAKSGTEDTAWKAVKGAINAEGATLKTVMNTFGEGVLPSQLTTAINNFNDFDNSAVNSTVEKVNDANSKLTALGTKESYSWDELRPILQLLADPDAMLINGILPSEILNGGMQDLVNSVMGGKGLTVSMGTGGGVYADIADHCGDYTASVTIQEVTYGGVTLNNMNARMATQSDYAPNYYLVVISNAFNDTSAEGPGLTAPTAGSEIKPISDMYGYVIDLAFRTNAAESDLLLQQDAVDRIYDGNTNENTMGHGSSMTFASTSPDFSNDQVKGLMDAIRLIFFNPDDGEILVKGRLNTEANKITIDADGVTAKIELYTGEAGSNAETWVKVTSGGTHKQETKYEEITDWSNYVGDLYTYDTDNNKYVKVTDRNSIDDEVDVYKFVVEYKELTDADKSDSSVVQYVKVTGAVPKVDNVITALTQNSVHKVSVLVYLDGSEMGNDDVAATVATSMTGKMNLQFSSSATLVPMEYADLHIAGEATNLTAITVNGADGASANGSFVGKNVTINLSNIGEGNTVTGVTVGGTAVTNYTFADGKLTFTHDTIAADIAVAITVGTASAGN